MKNRLLLVILLLFCSQAFAQPKLEKFPFRLNWTLYGEHAPFFVARDKGFYAAEGLDVEIQEGSGSTTVAQLVASLNGVTTIRTYCPAFVRSYQLGLV